MRWESESEENAKDGKGVTEDSMVPQEARGTLWPNFTLGLLPCSKGQTLDTLNRVPPLRIC